jgi:hypothetical protein
VIFEKGNHLAPATSPSLSSLRSLTSTIRIFSFLAASCSSLGETLYSPEKLFEAERNKKDEVRNDLNLIVATLLEIGPYD